MQFLYIPKDPPQQSLTQAEVNTSIQGCLLSYHLMHKDGQKSKEKNVKRSQQ